MRKILFLIRTLRIGGAEHVLVDVANRMTEKGFSITVQTLLDDGNYRNLLHPKVQYRPGVRTNSSLLRKIVMKLFYILPPWILGRALIPRGYTHLVAFVEGLPTKVIFGCPQNHVKKVAWIHTDLSTNSDTIDIFGTCGRYGKAYQAFDQILCVSNEAKVGFVRKVGEHRALDVQHNPIDKDVIIRKSQEVPAYLIPKSQVFRIVALGRLVKVKGFDLLIEAMAKVIRSIDKKVELYIIGGGAEESALKRLIEEYQLQNTVYLCGQQTNPYSIMRQCDMQVLSSRAEGYPLALCEGHFLGLPAVSTRCTGPTEIIEASRGGILVELSADGLADGIIEMISNGAQFDTYRKNVKNWADRYSVDEVYAQIEARFS